MESIWTGDIVTFCLVFKIQQGGQLPNLNRWLRPYNVQEILCGSCSSTVPTGNTVEVDETTLSKTDSNAIKYDGKVVQFRGYQL